MSIRNRYALKVVWRQPKKQEGGTDFEIVFQTPLECLDPMSLTGILGVLERQVGSLVVQLLLYFVHLFTEHLHHVHNLLIQRPFDCLKHGNKITKSIVLLGPKNTRFKEKNGHFYIFEIKFNSIST